MRKAFVLLSGGLDSTTCLYQARKQFDTVEAVSMDYGQRHKKEFDYARKTCEDLGITHSVLNLGGILSGKGIMLTDASVEVPNISYDDIQGLSPTFVPYRNGLMLSAITAHAQKWVNEQITATSMEACKDIAGIYAGMHSEDAANWAYPDCTPEFIGAQANAIYIGSYQTIRLYTPLQWLMKDEIVTLGSKLGVPFEATWSCYKGEELQCGVCPTCRSRKQAFIAAGVEDPTTYKE